MDRWDVIIILGAGYVAVMSLVRLMSRRRDQVVGYVREKIAESRGIKRPTKEPVQNGEEVDSEAA